MQIHTLHISKKILAKNRCNSVVIGSVSTIFFISTNHSINSLLLPFGESPSFRPYMCTERNSCDNMFTIKASVLEVGLDSGNKLAKV